MRDIVIWNNKQNRQNSTIPSASPINCPSYIHCIELRPNFQDLPYTFWALAWTGCVVCKQQVFHTYNPWNADKKIQTNPIDSTYFIRSAERLLFEWYSRWWPFFDLWKIIVVRCCFLYAISLWYISIHVLRSCNFQTKSIKFNTFTRLFDIIPFLFVLGPYPMCEFWIIFPPLENVCGLVLFLVSNKLPEHFIPLLILRMGLYYLLRCLCFPCTLTDTYGACRFRHGQ